MRYLYLSEIFKKKNEYVKASSISDVWMAKYVDQRVDRDTEREWREQISSHVNQVGKMIVAGTLNRK